MIRSGFRLPWLSGKAPLMRTPPPFRPPADTSAFQTLDQEIADLLLKEATTEIPPPASPGFYGRIFVVPKSSGGWRPVLDLSPLNRFLQDKPFKMETASSIRDSIHPGDWATSIDLKDAYFHILIHPRDRKWLRFVWKEKVFQFRALPFGLAPAPWVFTKVTRELCIHAHEAGIRLRVYLDDWLILASSKEQCLEHTRFILDLCLKLGFQVNPGKSDLTPSQSFTYLGMRFDTVSWLVRPSQQRLDRLNSLLTNLSNLQSASARQLSALLGQMESLSPLIRLGRLFKREFQRQFRSRWSQRSQPWDTSISLGTWFLQSTSQWFNQQWLSQGVPIVPPPPQEDLYTDASKTGWGAHVGTLTASGVWGDDLSGSHINLLELEAVVLALDAFSTSLSGKSVRVCTDNTTVACYINKQGGARSKSLSLRTEHLLLWCQARNITLSAKHVPGKINILADSLSRAHSVIHTEWTLAHSALKPVWKAWHTPHVDLFATRFSHRLPTYVSPVPDPNALAVDAFAISWRNLVSYAFPPFPVLGKVLRKAREDQAAIILIAPRWPAQPWYPDLLLLSHVPPLKLRIGPRSLLQPRSGIPHGNPGMLDLHAWLLCGNLCRH